MFERHKPVTEPSSADRAQVPAESQQPAIHVFFVGMQWCQIEIGSGVAPRAAD